MLGFLGWASNYCCVLALFFFASTRYADKNRRFAVVDVLAHPDVAEDLNISTAGTSKQIPTLALFASGRWVCGPLRGYV